MGHLANGPYRVAPSPDGLHRTPAINVEATAPIPGVRIPSLPEAGSMFRDENE